MIRVLSALLLFVCGSGVVHASDRKAEVDDIREATFRYQIQEASDPAAKVYFLGIDDYASDKVTDPDDAFMKRFMNQKLRVLKASQSASAKVSSRVIDKATGDPGLLLTLSLIKWTSDETVEVEGGVYASGDGGGSGIYYLKKENGKWVVTKFTATSVS